MLLPGMKRSLLLVQRTVTRTIVLQETIGKGAPTVFTDGSKTGCGVYMIDAQPPVQHQFQPGTLQLVELQIVIEVFKACPFPFNLLSDSRYVINALKGQQDPVWVPEYLVRKVQHRKDNDKEDSDCPDGAHRYIHGDDGTKMGDPVGVPETDAS
ncbi:hypothetical protein STEG23_037382 [Scotinomys teguina]